MDRSQFQQQVTQWFVHLKVERNVSEHTLRAYRSDIDQFLAFWDEASSVDMLLDMSIVLERYVLHLFYRKTSRATLARKISCLRSLRRFLRAAGIALTLRVRPPRVERKLPAVLSVDEIFFLLDNLASEALPSRFPLRDLAILELLYATGVRCSELVGITLGDISATDRTIRVLGKGKRERLVLFGSRAEQRIMQYLQSERRLLAAKHDCPYLFLNVGGGQLSTRSVQRIIEMFRAYLSAGRALTPHKVRHSFATHLLHEGVDLRVIKELLGHKTIATTEIYTQVTSEHLARVCDEKHPLNFLDVRKKGS